MRRTLSPGRLLPALLFLLAGQAAPAQPDIAIIVDGLPLDAKAIAVKDEVYVPAWILENYAHTKVKWMRRGNVLEILTATPGDVSPPPEGKLKLKVGFYLNSEGFVVGKNARLYLLNIDPKEFVFPDGKTPAERAHEGTVERIGNISEAMHEYLSLPPTERFTAKGWRIVARMPMEEIVSLSATVDRYELLYKSLYYDLITNLVSEKEHQIRTSAVIDDSLKGIKVENIPLREDGSAEITLGNGLYFLYARMLYRNRQVVWDMPVAVRGGETAVELSNRNAALVH
ncbi:MAG: hypothetical protein HZA60_06825 [Deltaproteobacteria bacterium]|nr:hypothetical protein [Deltaproteobacteria bacterium]